MVFTLDLLNKMKNIPNFGGVYSRDTLPDLFTAVPAHQLPIGIIANTDRQTEPGRHWVAIIIEKPGKPGEYFDSYGFPPINHEFNQWLCTHCADDGYVYNSVPIQCTECITCGEYCVAYLLCRLKARKSFKQFISLFTNNLRINDQIIRQFYNFI